MESVRHALQELIGCGDELADELAAAVARLGIEEARIERKVNFVAERVGASDEMKSEIEKILTGDTAAAEKTPAVTPDTTAPEQGPTDVQSDGVS